MIAIVIVAGVIAGCDEKKESAGADASASASVAKADSGEGVRAPGTGTGTGTGTSEKADGGPLRLCRVMASEGGPSASADASGWLDVGDKGSFTVRTLETGRELRFEGPGRVRACGDDVALVATGAAVGLPGSGEAPGAEQWAATACGVARWASGVHRLAGARDACKLQASMGTAQLWTADDITVEELGFDGGPPPDAGPRGSSPWQRIDARRALRLHGQGPLDTPAAVKAALAGCERAAREVQDLAGRMSTPEAGSSDIGELAARSVGARGVARAACAVAAVRVALAGSRPDDQARLDASSARWRAPH